MLAHADAIVVLGGGRDKESSLTPLSKARLDKGYELFKQGRADKIFALGGKYSTYTEDAICFGTTGAELRRDYLLSKGDVNTSNIVMVKDGRDTVYEAFACRRKSIELGVGSILLVTSEKHMPRALFVFQRIFGKHATVYGGPNTSAFTGDLLLSTEEKEYLMLWKEAFSMLPKDIPDPSSWEHWYTNNIFYYNKHKEIHDRFHPPGGPESQAYLGRSAEGGGT